MKDTHKVKATVLVTLRYEIAARSKRALREAMTSLRHETYPASGYGYAEVGDLDAIDYWYETARSPKVSIDTESRLRGEEET